MCAIETINIDGISLVGFRIDADSQNPELYTLITYGANEVPLVVNKKLVFFSSPECAAIAYDYFSEDIKRMAPPPGELDAVCDFAGTMYIINHESADDTATVLNCLNIIFDLLAAIRIEIPNEYREVLYDVADHLTFNKEFATYFEQQGIARDLITDGVFWCVGALLLNSRLIDGGCTQSI